MIGSSSLWGAPPSWRQEVPSCHFLFGGWTPISETTPCSKSLRQDAGDSRQDGGAPRRRRPAMGAEKQSDGSLGRGNDGIAGGEGTEVAEVERVKGAAAGAAGSDQVESVVDGSAGEVLFHRQFHGVAVVIGVQWDQGETGENALPDDALDVGWEQARLERQRAERGKEFGEAVGGQVALQRPRFHGLKTREGDGMVGVLLKQRRNQSGGVKTDFHSLKTADFLAALGSLCI